MGSTCSISQQDQSNEVKVGSNDGKEITEKNNALNEEKEIPWLLKPYFNQGKSLTTIDLNNKIGKSEAIALSKNTTWTKLTTLDLTYNDLEAKGASELAKNTSWTKLTTLDLSKNTIGAEGSELQLDEPYHSTIRLERSW